MNDYEKLKIVLDVAEKNNIKVGYYLPKEKLIADNVEDLILLIQQFSKKCNKYEVGKTYWYLEQEDSIYRLEPIPLEITEVNKNWFRDNEEFYPTRKSLIESQIEYWKNLLEEDSEDELIERLRKPKYTMKECQEQFRRYCEINGIQINHNIFDSHGCQHEFDGKFYDLLGNECDVGNTMHFKVKCKKCGECWGIL